MRRDFIYLPEDGSIENAIRYLIKYKVDAILITDAEDRAVGVVSKTDLIMAYKHGISPEAEAGTIMNAPVRACDEQGLLIKTIKMMMKSII